MARKFLNFGRKTIRWTIISLLLIGLAIYIWWGAIPDPEFSLTNLRGLTPGLVIAKVGQPDIDPRLPKWGGWKPVAEAGPLIFTYHNPWKWRGLSYGVVFKDDHVVRVDVGEK